MYMRWRSVGIAAIVMLSRSASERRKSLDLQGRQHYLPSREKRVSNLTISGHVILSVPYFEISVWITVK